MSLALALALQAAGAEAAASRRTGAEAAAARTAGAGDVAPIDFDLAKHRPAERRGCGSAEGAEIIVCGRRSRGDDYPMEEMARRYEEKPLKAEMDLGNGATGGISVEQVVMPDGQVSKRVMVGVKIRF